MPRTVFQHCIAALDRVARAFTKARKGTGRLSFDYMADYDAWMLMQQVCLHVKSLIAIAELPGKGAHLISAWVVLRAAFETGAISLWLTQPDDWKEREARWVGWAKSEEKYLDNLAKDYGSHYSDLSEQCRNRAIELRARREDYMRRLPKDTRYHAPKWQELLKEIGLDERYFGFYRVGSHSAHGGAGLSSIVAKRTDVSVNFGNAVSVAEWVHPFRMASWSISQPGIVVLERAGIADDALETIVEAHDHLREVTGKLIDTEKSPGN